MLLLGDEVQEFSGKMAEERACSFDDIATFFSVFDEKGGI